MKRARPSTVHRRIRRTRAWLNRAECGIGSRRCHASEPQTCVFADPMAHEGDGSRSLADDDRAGGGGEPRARRSPPASANEDADSDALLALIESFPSSRLAVVAYAAPADDGGGVAGAAAAGGAPATAATARATPPPALDRFTVTYGELTTNARELARALRLRRGCVVAAVLGNSVETVVVELACLLARAVVVPVNPAFPARELADVLALVRPRVVACAEGNADVARAALLAAGLDAAPPRTLETTCGVRRLTILERPPTRTSGAGGSCSLVAAPGDAAPTPWAVLFTSGTSSGQKKGVARGAGATLRGMALHRDAMGLAREVYGMVWPMSGISSFFFTWAVLGLGGTVVCAGGGARAPAVDVDAVARLACFAREGVTFVTGSPAHVERMLMESAPRLHALRSVLVSGAPCSYALKRRARVQLGARVHEAYGSTETGLLTLLRDEDWFGAADEEEAGSSVGAEPRGAPALRVLDDGSVLAPCAGPMFMAWPRSYVCADEAQRRAPVVRDDADDAGSAGSADSAASAREWFVTGDVARRDARGRMHLLGRRDDRVVLPDGHDFYPPEVESVLSQPPARTVVVFAARGVVCGVVVAGGAREDADVFRELDDVARERLAPFKRPAQWRRVDALERLPLTSTNKLRRRDLERWWADHEPVSESEGVYSDGVCGAAVGPIPAALD